MTKEQPDFEVEGEVRAFDFDCHNRQFDSALIKEITMLAKAKEEIILLDLNSTLAEYYYFHPSNKGTYDPLKDVYSQELVAEIGKRNVVVVIITARPARYALETINHIRQQTKLQFAFYICKSDEGSIAIDRIKPAVASAFVDLPKEKMLCLESNPKTKAGYRSIGIQNIFTRAGILNQEKD